MGFLFEGLGLRRNTDFERRRREDYAEDAEKKYKKEREKKNIKTILNC